MNGLAKLGELWHSMQTWLFPCMEDELGELDEKHREFVAVCHGGRHVRVRGAVKVAAHLSFGLLVIAAEQLITMIC